MNTSKRLVVLLGLLAPLAMACGASGSPAGSESEVVTGSKLTDAKLKTALQDALKDHLYISEGDYPWHVVDGDGAGVAQIDAKTIAERLGATIKGIDDQHRDLSQVRSEEGSVDDVFASLEDGGEDAEEAYSKTRGLLKTNLTDLRYFEFDVDDRGNQGTGPIVVVIVGKSASNKLIALVTFAVST